MHIIQKIPYSNHKNINRMQGYSLLFIDQILVSQTNKLQHNPLGRQLESPNPQQIISARQEHAKYVPTAATGSGIEIIVTLNDVYILITL